MAQHLILIEHPKDSDKWIKSARRESSKEAKALVKYLSEQGFRAKIETDSTKPT